MTSNHAERHYKLICTASSNVSVFRTSLWTTGCFSFLYSRDRHVDLLCGMASRACSRFPELSQTLVNNSHRSPVCLVCRKFLRSPTRNILVASFCKCEFFRQLSTWVSPSCFSYGRLSAVRTRRKSAAFSCVEDFSDDYRLTCPLGDFSYRRLLACYARRNL